jgi:DNA-binding NarL/FixJ family response regulator
VLLDLGLPDSSGPESYAWVREVCPKLPVVVLTGNNSEETEFAVTASGVEGYLVKDQVSGSLLLQAIRAALYANKQRKLRQSLMPKLFQPRFKED